MQILRNNASMPGILNGLQVIEGIVYNANSGSTAHNLVVETHIAGTASTFYNTILYYQAHYDATIVAPSISDSTTYPGTLKFTFAVPAQKYLIYRIVGTNGEVATDFKSADADITKDDAEIY